jgi:hypothetical protein
MLAETRLRFVPFVAILALVIGCSAPAPVEEAPAAPPPAEPAGTVSEEDFVSLFDGETLDGWHRHEGLPESNIGGKWEVIDGAIAGDQDPPGAGGFLTSTGTYKDYVLRLEANIDYPVDSGVFLRVGPTGKSHQLTLDNRPEGTIGSIYLPWTQSMVHENPGGTEHFKSGEWNDLEIRIEGEPARIQFHVNGHLVTDFQHTEETTKGVPEEGTICLQIHPGGEWVEGNKARFRNLRIKTLP